MSIQHFHLISTEDGTPSLFSDEYSQAMHSVSGAYQEAIKKHVIPSQILELKNKELNVLDIGFGLGYNILALVFESLRKGTGQKLNVMSLEMDFSHILFLNKIRFCDDRQFIYNNILKAIEKSESVFNNYKIKMLKGDARDSIKNLDDNFFDAVFHDPFSPSKNPELWTVDFFQEVNRIMKEHAILTTYSSAVQIRRSLLEAGFKVGKGPSVGKKREGTLATKSGQIQTLSDNETAELMANHKSVSYRDEFLNSTRDKILQKRKKCIREIRKLD